ncbi:MAG: hypothetical protein AAGA56_10360, partial [Myxococcota bacterium]
RGSLVPDAGHLIVWVFLAGTTQPIPVRDVTLQLVSNTVIGAGGKPIPPSFPGVAVPASSPLLAFGFRDLPKGRYEVLLAIDGQSSVGAMHGFAVGRTSVEIKTGLLNASAVVAENNRPLLNIDDPLLDLDHPKMQRRRKVLATIFKNFPQSAKPSTAHPAPYQQGPYQPMFVAGGGNTCTPINTAIMQAASGHGHLYGTNQLTHPGFVPFTGTFVPSVGDSLYLDNGKGHFEHCGIVVESTIGNGLWLMADGGQPDRTGPLQIQGRGVVRRPYSPPPSFEAAFIVPRFLHRSSGPAQLRNQFIYPGTESGGYHVRGFSDITHPQVPFSSVAYSNLGSEQDYLAMKTLIRKMRPLVDADRKRGKALLAQSLTP